MEQCNNATMTAQLFLNMIMAISQQCMEQQSPVQQLARAQEHNENIEKQVQDFVSDKHCFEKYKNDDS